MGCFRKQLVADGDMQNADHIILGGYPAGVVRLVSLKKNLVKEGDFPYLRMYVCVCVYV